MKKYRLISLLAAVLVAALSLASVVSAEDTTVYVTIANGDLVLAYAEVSLTDANGDGALTINDALINAHDAHYEGGASAGYGSTETEFGLSLTKLWGVDNGGAYGYCVNNASALSLADTVKPGDHIVAYVYTDLTAWSDTYSFFDTTTAEGSEVTLTLSASGYDENWAPVTFHVEGAVITVDGKKTDVATDADGRATVTGLDAGRHIISAVSDTVTLVPPVCVVTVAESAPAPDTAPSTGFGAFSLIAVAAAAATVILTSRREKVR